VKGPKPGSGEFSESQLLVRVDVGGRWYVYIVFYIAEGARPMNGFCARVFTDFVQKVAQLAGKKRAKRVESVENGIKRTKKREKGHQFLCKF